MPGWQNATRHFREQFIPIEEKTMKFSTLRNALKFGASLAEGAPIEEE